MTAVPTPRTRAVTSDIRVGTLTEVMGVDDLGAG